MLATELLLTALNRNWDMIDDAIDGMDDSMIARIPQLGNATPLVGFSGT